MTIRISNDKLYMQSHGGRMIHVGDLSGSEDRRVLTVEAEIDVNRLFVDRVFKFPVNLLEKDVYDVIYFKTDAMNSYSIRREDALKYCTVTSLKKRECEISIKETLWYHNHFG